MNWTSTKKCPRCNRLGIVVNSNNPLSPGLCKDCLAQLVRYDDLVSANNFCRTYNIPFNPDKWMRIAKEMKSDMFDTYISVVMDEYKKDPNYKDPEDKTELWARVNNIWNKNLEFEEIMLEISSVKEDWLKIMRTKWGSEYEFSELLRLEELTNSTIRSTGATSPLIIDTIRKLATTSIMIDKAIKQGEVKAAGELSKMYQTFIKSGGFEEIIDVASDNDVIANVADLCNYLEENDFQFKFYDNVSRDIVDKTILDQQNWTRRFVLDSAGIIQQEYDIISESWKNKLENDRTQDATSRLSLEEIIEQKKKGINEELDGSLENEEYGFDEDDVDGEYKY